MYTKDHEGAVPNSNKGDIIFITNVLIKSLTVNT